MMYLPEEIITTEILTRLPVKPLFRFRVVKKSWCDLKNDSDFIKRHLEHSIKKNEYQTLYTSNAGEVCAINQSLLISSGVVGIQKFDVPYGKFHYVPGRFKPTRPLRLIRILCSCNGLLFVDMSDGRGGDGWATGLWNPATREFKILPVATTPIGCNRISGLNFENRCGFGYDKKIDDYKVVRIAVPSNTTDESMASQVDVYTLGSDSWRKIEDTPYKITDSSAGVFANGALHWLANPSPGRSKSESKFSHVLISFNMSEEIFSEIPYLVSFEEFEHKRIDTLEGSLCMHCSSTVCFEVWVMSEYGVGDSWTKLYTISRQLLIDTAPKIIVIVPSFVHLRRIQPLRNGEFFLKIQLRDDSAGLVFYDPKHETARFHKIKWPECSRAPCFDRRESLCYTETYVESLVSLCSGNYVGSEREDTFESLVSLHSGIYVGSDQEDSDSDPNESDDEWETVSGSDPDESDDERETTDSD